MTNQKHRKNRFGWGLLVRGIAVSSLWWRLSAFASTTVTLAWNPSPLVAGYRIYYGGNSGVYTNQITVGNATNVTLSGLTGGLTYHFAAASYSASGQESALSSDLAYFVPAQAVLSLRVNRSNNGVPTSVLITASGTVPVSWTLQSSTDLKHWINVAQGTNPVVNSTVPINRTPLQYFRLLGQ